VRKLIAPPAILAVVFVLGCQDTKKVTELQGQVDKMTQQITDMTGQVARITAERDRSISSDRPDGQAAPGKGWHDDRRNQDDDVQGHHRWHREVPDQEVSWIIT